MAGIYIHIPFCKSRCKYCDFFSTTQLQLQDSYVRALLAEWNKRKLDWQSTPIHTIYIGGGTPSLLTIPNIQLLLRTILRDIDTTHLREVTLEANPGDFTEEKVRAWRSLGINRLSIGIQSFHDPTLLSIGRRHTASQAIDAVRIAQEAGIDNISIDLMYALPGQTMSDWQHDIAQALSLSVNHISSYGLIYEPETLLTRLLQEGKIEMVDEDEEIAMYDYLVQTLTQHGYEHYEVSNFALPGKHSQHNSSYWNDTPYLGLGAGAHSYDGKSRWWNIEDIAIYIDQATTDSLCPEQELLTDEQRHTERVMLGLRTAHGVAVSDVRTEHIQAYIKDGLLLLRDDRIVATTQGFHVLNRIIQDLV
jgi:oxygen-independent coproporphyrinogen-3 oxidase